MFQNTRKHFKTGIVSVASIAGLSAPAFADQAAAEAAITAAGTTAQTVGWVVVGALALLVVIKMVKRVM